MRIIESDADGNIFAVHNEGEAVEGLLVTVEQAEKIMANPLGFKVENGELIEAGYQPEINPTPSEIERIEEIENMVNLIILGVL